MSVKSKHSSVKSKHSSVKSFGKNKEKKSKTNISDEDFESSEEELDLTKECHPIGYYMNNKLEMINQMFSVIKGNKLKAMLPPILKDCDIEHLKLQCLDQLLGMSEKRITCILEGGTLDSSSESEVYDSDDCEKKKKSSGFSSDSDGGQQPNNSVKKPKKRKIESNTEKLPKTESEQPEQGKTLLEILELEMRARAIRALLKQSNEKSDEVIEEPKPEVNGAIGEVVDLTECEDDELSVPPKKNLEEEIDKKISNFEEKIEKSKLNKTTPQMEKTKRLQAEFGFRSKLIKNKIYRTREQRMENCEEEQIVEAVKHEEIPSLKEEVVVKKEPVEPEPQVIVIEDPEEGEVSSSEEDLPVEIKKEPVEEPDNDLESKVDENVEMVSAIDNGTFVSNNTGESTTVEEEETPMEVQEEADVPENNQTETAVQPESEKESESIIAESSWRQRWLQKDGVQKLVKSSKILAKVKKRIAQKTLKAKEEVGNLNKGKIIEGSMEEYEKLLGKDQKQEENETSSQMPEQKET